MIERPRLATFPRFVYDDVALVCSTELAANTWSLDTLGVTGTEWTRVPAKIMDDRLNCSSTRMDLWGAVREGDEKAIAEAFPDQASPTAPFMVAWNISDWYYGRPADAPRHAFQIRLTDQHGNVFDGEPHEGTSAESEVTADPIVVIGLDVGSVQTPGRFAWAAADGLTAGQDNPTALADVVVAALDQGRRVALAVECPLTVPVPPTSDEEWRALGKARSGEGNRAWSASAGASALATGLVQLAWLCRYLNDHCRVQPTTTTDAAAFMNAEAQLLIVEAFVTGDGKPVAVESSQDLADARAAAVRLDEILVEPTTLGDSVVQCSPHRPLNLAAAAALHAGLPIDPRELQSEVLVAKVRPQNS